MRYTHLVDILKSPLIKSLVLFGSAAGLSSCGSSNNANATQATPSIDKQETIEVLHNSNEPSHDQILKNIFTQTIHKQISSGNLALINKLNELEKAFALETGKDPDITDSFAMISKNRESFAEAFGLQNLFSLQGITRDASPKKIASIIKESHAVGLDEATRFFDQKFTDDYWDTIEGLNRFIPKKQTELERLRMYKALDIPNSPEELAEIEAAQKKYAPVFDTRTEEEKKDFIAQGLMKRDDLFALGYGVTAKLLELGGDKEINKLVKKIQDKYTLSEAQADDIFYQAFHQGTMQIKADGSVSMAPLVKDPETGRNYYSGGVWTQDGKFIGSMDQRREEYRAKTGLPKDVVSPIQLMEAARVADALGYLNDNFLTKLEDFHKRISAKLKTLPSDHIDYKKFEEGETNSEKEIIIYRSVANAAKLLYGIDSPKDTKAAKLLFHGARKDLLHFGVRISKRGTWLNSEEFAKKQVGISKKYMEILINILGNIAKDFN